MKWSLLHSDYLLRTPWLTVRKDCVRMPSGFEMDDFYVLEYADWVNVIAITEDNLFVMEEQYRHGIRSVGYELCAGNVEKGEAPLQCAQRELLEETGYAGGEWIPFGKYAPNTSAMTNYCHCFIARGVRKISSPKLESSEQIKVHLLDRDELLQHLRNENIAEGIMQAPLWKFFYENK